MVQWFRRSGAPEPPLLDEEFLARLGKHIGTVELRELMADGLMELSDRLDVLSEHANRGEVEEVSALCHEIAGAAGHLGLTRISTAAVEGVRRCRGRTSEPATDIVADILAVRSESMAAANKFCQVEDETPVREEPASANTCTDPVNR